MDADFRDLRQMKGHELGAVWREQFGEEPPETRSAGPAALANRMAAAGEVLRGPEGPNTAALEGTGQSL